MFQDIHWGCDLSHSSWSTIPCKLCTPSIALHMLYHASLSNSMGKRYNIYHKALICLDTDRNEFELKPLRVIIYNHWDRINLDPDDKNQYVHFCQIVHM